MAYRSEADAVLDKVFRLAIWSGPVDPQPLGGGITNRNFVVEDQGKKYVVRVGADIPVHGILRCNELAASRAAHQAGLSPAVVHAEPDIMVIDHIDGKTFMPVDVRNPDNLERISELVRRCHTDVAKALRGPSFMFWPFHVIRDYAHTLRLCGSRHAPLLPILLQTAEQLEKAVGPIDVVFGHNDLLAANIMDDGKKLWLLDWEYAGFNSPLFDLAGLASNSEMPSKMTDELIARYFERPIDDRLRHSTSAMIATSLLREAMWSMVSESYSTVDFDYAAYTAENLRRFDGAMKAHKDLETS